MKDEELKKFESCGVGARQNVVFVELFWPSVAAVIIGLLWFAWVMS